MNRLSTRSVHWLVAGLVMVVTGACSLSQPRPVEVLREILSTLRELADTYDTVQDEVSALAAVETIETCYNRMVSLQDEMIALHHTQPDLFVSKRIVADLQKEQQQVTARLRATLARLEETPGLPARFWNVVRIGSARSVVAGLRTLRETQGAIDEEGFTFGKKLCDLLEQHGPERVIEVELTGLQHGAERRVGRELVAVAGGNADTIHAWVRDQCLMIVAPVDDFGKIASVVTRFGTVHYQDESRRWLAVDADSQKLDGQDRPQGGEKPAVTGRRQSGRGDRSAEVVREAIERARLAYQDKIHGPDPGDADYYEQLVRHMQDGVSPYQDKAIRVLLATKPSEVPSKETRKEIARGFRNLAFDDPFKEDEGVRGLAIWGGKYSVPLLLEMLGERHPSAADEVYRALGRLQDPRAAAPVAAKLGDFFAHDQAVACLREMGPVAEDAILAVAPSDDPKTALAAVQLLGAVGAQKSLPTLRAALRSRNFAVQSAAKAAIKEILRRGESIGEK